MIEFTEYIKEQRFKVGTCTGVIEYKDGKQHTNRLIYDTAPSLDFLHHLSLTDIDDAIEVLTVMKKQIEEGK